MKLSEIPAALAAMLVKPVMATETELTYLAVYDLLYRDILRLSVVWRAASVRRSELSPFVYIEKVPAYPAIILPEHQQPFIDVFKRDKNPVFLKNFVVPALQKITFKYKNRLIYRDLKYEDFFRSSFGMKKYDVYQKRFRGKVFGIELKKMLKEAEIQLPAYVAKADVAQLSQLIKQLGPNIFLLDCFNQDLHLQLLALDFSEVSSDKQLPRLLQEENLHYSISAFVAAYENAKRMIYVSKWGTTAVPDVDGD
jgi:hypothetical protein